MEDVKKKELETGGSLQMGSKKYPQDECIAVAAFPLKGLVARRVL